MLNRADEAVVRAWVGARSFDRGQTYARQGRVLRSKWESANRVTGTVTGRGAQPYRTSVTLTRSGSGRLSALVTSCTCPVGHLCKHAVALMVAAEPKGSGRAVRPAVAGSTVRRAPGRTAAPPGWEQSLAALLANGGAEERDASQVGLQFELAAERQVAARGAPRGRPGAPAIQLWPLVLSPAGNWVRTGISWANLDYVRYRREQDDGSTAEAIGLLKELLATSRPVGSSPYWAARDVVVTLESVRTRRVWDLFGQLRELGAPLLLRAGGHAGAVALERPSEVAIDVTRPGPGLRVEARYESAGSPIPPGSSLLVGNPAHGIAWWDEGGGGMCLHVGPFAGKDSAAERRLVGSGPLLVPERDAARFVEEICPRLGRRMTVRSSDGSVDLTSLPETALILSVRHQAGHRVELAWRRGVPGGWSEGLWDTPDSCVDPGVDDAIDAATPIVTKLAALTEAGPAGERITADAELVGMDAVLFVTDLLPLLEEVEGLEIEQHGTPLPYRASPEAPVVRLGGSESADGDWFDLSVEVSVGGEAVAFHELFVALAQEHSHLILPSGTYFSLDGPELGELARLIAEARALNDPERERVRLSRYQASLWEDFQCLGVLTAQAEAWQASVQALTRAPERSGRRLPAGLKATLRPYQAVGFRWLAFLYEHRLGGILADDMGLGKTLQALALICHARGRGRAPAPFLVVAPTSVVGNWVAECQRFTPTLKAAAVTETAARRGSALKKVAEGADVVVTSYALFRLEYHEYERVEWAGMFLDEAQFAKNANSQSYRRAKSLPVPFKVAMTGTPMENNLMELWSLLSISAPGLFPRADHFSEHFRQPIERASDAERLALLRRRISPLMLRRTKEQVAADLPAKQEQVLELDLDARHHRLYQTYLQRERQKVLGLIGDLHRNRFEIFRSLTLLRQASLDLSLLDPKHARVPSTKLDVLMPMIEDAVADGHKVLVFSQFTRFLTLARRRVQAAGIAHCYLDGRTRRRAEVIADFRQGKAPVFLVSLKAGGVGLNLTEADYCILLDPWWNPATEAQAVDRAHRIGQTRKVMVYRLVAKETIEEKVMALKAKKAALFANVIDGGGFESGTLTAEDIRQLVS
ncbi:MAG: DEAD/DEAH box helicase [Acidimicrobiales bacterium]